LLRKLLFFHFEAFVENIVLFFVFELFFEEICEFYDFERTQIVDSLEDFHDLREIVLGKEEFSGVDYA